MTARNRTLVPIVLIVSLFFLWGMANNLNDVLIAHFKRAFTLSDLQSGLVQSAFYLGYFCFAIPAALFMRRFDYKGGVVFGLVLYSAGALLFWPAASLQSYGFFLFALFVIASGLAFLETAANPMVAALGDPAAAAKRLNLAQAFNPLGSIAGIEIGRRFILSNAPSGTGPLDAATRALEAQSARIPYAIIGCGVLLWAVLALITKFPAIATAVDDEKVGNLSQYRTLLRNSRYIAGVAAQFFYVGAQVGVWSFIIRYAQSVLPGISAPAAALYVTATLILFTVGRFIGTALLVGVRAAPLLLGFAAINTGLCLFAAFYGGYAGLLALVATSFFMSIMFPTIFVLALRGLGPLTKPGASLVVMAIIGGAVLTALMGYISDVSGAIAYAMIVPAVCFAIIALFARLHLRDPEANG